MTQEVIERRLRHLIAMGLRLVPPAQVARPIEDHAPPGWRVEKQREAGAG